MIRLMIAAYADLSEMMLGLEGKQTVVTVV